VFDQNNSVQATSSDAAVFTKAAGAAVAVASLSGSVGQSCVKADVESLARETSKSGPLRASVQSVSSVSASPLGGSQEVAYEALIQVGSGNTLTLYWDLFVLQVGRVAVSFTHIGMTPYTGQLDDSYKAVVTRSQQAQGLQ
jgi:hypothetical protein